MNVLTCVPLVTIRSMLTEQLCFSQKHCNPVQGQYRARTGFSLCSKFSQGKIYFYHREPLFSLQGPCIHYREFPVRITTQGNPCSHYREWVCSACSSRPLNIYL